MTEGESGQLNGSSFKNVRPRLPDWIHYAQSASFFGFKIYLVILKKTSSIRLASLGVVWLSILSTYTPL